MATVKLKRWRVVEFGGGMNSHHLVGFAEIPVTGYPMGRISSPVVSFDRATMTAVTRSGNRYVLTGPKDGDPDGGLVLIHWLQRNDVLLLDDDCDLDVLPPERLS